MLILIFSIFSLNIFISTSNPMSDMSGPDIKINENDHVQSDDSFPAQQKAYPTRGSRAIESEPNNKPENASLISRSSLTSITGEMSSSSDIDWFKMKLDVYDSNNFLNEIDNFTISLLELTGDTNYNLGLFVYGVYDINQDNVIDFESELILMNCSVYRIGQSFQEVLSIKSYISEYYYIKLQIDGGEADYRFQLRYETSAPFLDSNQDIKYSTTLSAPETHSLYMSLDTFDWFFEKKIIYQGADGVNFSINVNMNNYNTEPAMNYQGSTYYFVTVLHMLVYHEGNIVGGKPAFPYQYRDHVVTSKNTVAKLPKSIEYSDIITKPTHIYKYTYLGFFVESFCVDPTKPGEKLYPLTAEMEEFVQNTYCTYTIEEKSITPFIRPELSKASVVSLSNNKIYGKTYDTYKYSVIYSQQDNFRPLTAKISIFTLNGELIDDMKKVTEGTGAQNIWKTGCRYEYKLSGLELGEGNHHVYQFHFKDKNVHSNGTIEVGKTWHGPYISNNIEPFVRPSAPDELILYEDDNTTFYSLNNIFEDADLQEILNYTIADPEVDMAQRDWVLEFTSNIVDISIENQTRLKIEPKPNKNGEVQIILNVTDKKAFFATHKLKVKILPVNDPPQIVQYFSKIVFDEDEVYTDINMAEHMIDLIDDEELDYWVENNKNLMVEIDQNYNVRIKPNTNWHGFEFIDFYASDGEETVTDFLKVVVKSVNDPPEVRINKTIELWEGNWTNFTLDASDSADNETVIIGHNLTEIFPVLLKTPLKYGYSFDNFTGYFTFRPANSMVGTYSWNVSAIDMYDSLNYTHVTLVIHNVNDPPVAQITFPMNGARYLTTDKISFRGTGTDIDTPLKESDFIWYSVLNGIQRKIGSGRSLPPQLYENGTHLIILALSDGEYIYNATIAINVYSINQDLDIDDDGIPNYWENLYYFNIHDPHDADDDADKDTFSNWEEFQADTDPHDPNSVPEKHISKEKSEVEPDYSWLIWVFVVIIIVLAVVIIFMWLRTQKRLKAEEEARLSTDGIRGMTPMADQGQGGMDRFKQPKVICHKCGKSLDILTLNRPLVVKCTDCGEKGVVYK
jgi:hypothetical protein